MQIKAKGVDALVKSLKTLAGDLDELEPTNLSIQMAKLAQRLAPHDTGKLAASIKPFAGNSKAGFYSEIAYGFRLREAKVPQRVDAAMQGDAQKELQKVIDKLIEGTR